MRVRYEEHIVKNDMGEPRKRIHIRLRVCALYSLRIKIIFFLMQHFHTQKKKVKHNNDLMNIENIQNSQVMVFFLFFVISFV